MGCDIHPYICRRTKDGKLESFSYEQLELARDYLAFGLMAGVRGKVQLFDPRGLPENLPFHVQYDFDQCKDDGCHTPSWLTTEEMRVVAKEYVRLQDEAIMRSHNVGECIAGIIGMMEGLEQWWQEHGDEGSAVLVFWFDC